MLTIDYGRPPWIAFTLAVSFALYGLVKKRAGIGGLQSVAVESAVLVVPAVAYIAWLEGSGRGTVASEGVGHFGLLAVSGAATAIPLILFGAAAVRIPLTTIGLLQYLAPTMAFLIGVLIYDEPMPASRLAGFALVWLALAIFTVDAVRTVRRSRAAASSSSSEAVVVAAAPAS